MKKLIITADDFGLDQAVNDAVEAGHSRGVLTAASLMVTGAAAEDAVTRARRLPRLGVGLHLVLVDGTPALPPGQIPDLVDSSGKFRKDAVAAGIRIFCSGAARRQAAAQADGRRAWFAAGILEGQFALLLRRRLDAAGIAHNDHIFGLADSGAMTGERVRRYLEVLPEGISEIYLHPATRQVAAYPAHYLSRGEYEALIDPMVASALARRGIARLPFAGLAGKA